jgi:hypothetical protein
MSAEARAQVAGLLALAAALPAQEPAFARDVLPVLQQACFACHRGAYTDETGRLRRPKGGLRLDGKAWILRGGKSGSVLTAGKPAQSPLHTRTVLPAEHEDRMPATGDPLLPEQSEVLRRWIDAGAAFGDWVGEGGRDATTPAGGAAMAAPAPVSNARTLDLARLAASLRPLPAPVIAGAAGARARIEPLWHGSALLRVGFAGHEDEVTDADVQSLLPVAPNIAVCLLARTKITAAACAWLARMPALVQLDLRDTRVDDAGIARLRGLPELRSLNLFATDVTDASVPVFASLPKLEELRLWQSKATAAGVAALRAQRPDLDVTLAPELPPAATAEEGQRGRRRGR